MRFHSEDVGVSSMWNVNLSSLWRCNTNLIEIRVSPSREYKNRNTNIGDIKLASYCMPLTQHCIVLNFLLHNVLRSTVYPFNSYWLLLYYVLHAPVLLTAWSSSRPSGFEFAVAQLETSHTYINQQDAQNSVIRLYFPLDAQHVSDYISSSSGATL